MKEELKTLKDMRADTLLEKAFSVRLKAEAIKWIKYLKYMQSQIKPPSNINAIYLSFTERIDWIKHFFNITEEDLKEEKQN